MRTRNSAVASLTPSSGTSWPMMIGPRELYLARCFGNAVVKQDSAQGPTSYAIPYAHHQQHHITFLSPRIIS